VSQPKTDVQAQQQSKPQDDKQNTEPPEDPNWKAFRDARKKDRAEREAAELRAAEKEREVAALKAAMEAAFSRSPAGNYAAPPQNAYDQHEETEDERIEKKVQAAIAARETAAEKARIEKEHQEYPNRLVQSFPDFHNTIAQEHLDYLDYHYPEVSRPLQRLPDGYDKWADIYRAVKKFVPNNATAKKDAAKADVNFGKPKSMSSTGITQPGEATTSARLTEEKRAENWARMQKVLKGVG
jgi:hypothetical protein